MNLPWELAEIARFERAQAIKSQYRAGVRNEAARTDFAQGGLEPEKEGAMQRIWEAGPESKQLYVKISKGLAAMNWLDVIALSRDPMIERLAGQLIAGASLIEARAWVWRPS
jgi:hypothetical protein